MRKTKIVATLGPASNDAEKIKELENAGVNVFRVNFSHSSHDDIEQLLNRIRNNTDNVAVMMDTKGAEIRIRNIDHEINLEEDDNVQITSNNTSSNRQTISVNYEEFSKFVEIGDQIIIGDDEVELTVTKNNSNVVCEVTYGGSFSSKKSVTVPRKDIGLEPITEKDIKDIKFGAEKGFDYVAASFIKKKEDVSRIEEIIDEKNSEMDIISKIEHSEAIKNFDDILEKSDGIMVARGDLGIQMPATDVPILQKEMIEKCNKKGKIAITATHMLKSMTDNPKATRAEVSDVANAVLDGTDAVMLSEETAIGEYPIKTVEMMSETVDKIEKNIEPLPIKEFSGDEIPDTICKNVYNAATEIDVKYILAHTRSGYTAKNIAKYRPKTKIVASTLSENIKNKLNMVWGVETMLVEEKDHIEDMFRHSVELLYEKDKVSMEDNVILTAGMPTKVSKKTNMMSIRKVKDILND